MKIKSQQDFFAGLLFVGLGIAFSVGALDYRLGPTCLPEAACAEGIWSRFVHLSSAPGPGYFPLGLGLLLTVLGGLLTFKALTFESDGGDRLGHVALAPLFFVVMSIVVFAFGLPRAGFYASAALSMAVAMMADSEVRQQGVRHVWLGALMGTGLAYVVVRWGTPPLQSVLVAAAQGVAGLMGGHDWVARSRYLGMVLAPILWMSAVVLAVMRLPERVRPLGAMAALYFSLIAGSVWLFSQGLGLQIPLLPAAFA